jgi:hypothetical protein
MTIDELLLQIRFRCLILIPESEVWPSPRLTCTIRRAIRRHRRGLALLIDWSDIAVCASPAWHHARWKYADDSRFVWEICELLLQEVA